MKQTVSLTKEGKAELEAELKAKKAERPAIADRIATARAFGDLSENSEYDEAKNEQAKIEARIVEIEAMLKNVEVIADIKGAAKTVMVGTKVKVLDIEFDEECTYKIVVQLKLIHLMAVFQMNRQSAKL